MRIRLLSVGVLAALFVVSSAVGVGAGHGEWHHNHHVYDPSSSTYRAYAHTKSSQNSDLLVAHIYAFKNGVTKVSRFAICGPVDEGCRSVTSPSGGWTQGGTHLVTSYHCGYDNVGNHHIIPAIGSSANWCAWNGEESHWHSTTWSD